MNRPGFNEPPVLNVVLLDSFIKKIETRSEGAHRAARWWPHQISMPPEMRTPHPERSRLLGWTRPDNGTANMKPRPQAVIVLPRFDWMTQIKAYLAQLVLTTLRNGWNARANGSDIWPYEAGGTGQSSTR